MPSAANPAGARLCSAAGPSGYSLTSMLVDREWQAMNTRGALAQTRGRRRAHYIWSADLDELLIEAYTGKTERWRAFRAIAKRT